MAALNAVVSCARVMPPTPPSISPRYKAVSLNLVSVPILAQGMYCLIQPLPPLTDIMWEAVDVTFSLFQKLATASFFFCLSHPVNRKATAQEKKK